MSNDVSRSFTQRVSRLSADVAVATDDDGNRKDDQHHKRLTKQNSRPYRTEKIQHDQWTRVSGKPDADGRERASISNISGRCPVWPTESRRHVSALET